MYYRRFSLILFFLLGFIFSCSAQNMPGANSDKKSSITSAQNIEKAIPQPAPKFVLSDLKEKKIALADYLGKQDILILFWTTWCPFCRQAIKELTYTYPQLKNKNIEVLAIDIDETATRVERFISGLNPDFKILLDEGGDLAGMYKVIGIPSYVLVDKNGYIQYQGNRLPKLEQ